MSMKEFYNEWKKAGKPYMFDWALKFIDIRCPIVVAMHTVVPCDNCPLTEQECSKLLRIYDKIEEC